jgi:multimeric flavodoxin WrbA
MTGVSIADMATLLVIHHSPTRTLQALTEQVVAGARDPEIEGVEVVVKQALDFATGAASHHDLLAADGYLLGTSANFGYMSGALKHVFDSTFLAIGGALDASGAGDPGAAGVTQGRPFGLYVHGRYDTTGAVRSVLSITGALGWRQSYQVLEVLGDPGVDDEESAYDLGGTIAALLTG